MLTVDQREEIRRAYFVEGKSIRRIARERRHDRRTMRKTLRDAGPPRHTLKAPRPRLILGLFLAAIDHWLEERKRSSGRQSSAARPAASTSGWSRSSASRAASPPSASTYGSAGRGSEK